MADVLNRSRVPLSLLGLVVHPMLGVALFWAITMMYEVFGEDALSWLPGATGVVAALGLPVALTALAAYRRRTSLPRAQVLVAGALVMAVVWFWLSWGLVVSIDGSSGDVYD